MHDAQEADDGNSLPVILLLTSEHLLKRPNLLARVKHNQAHRKG
jgi:hypothetical protein